MPVNFETFGDNSLLVSWPNNICQQTRLEIFHFNQLILREHRKSVVETVPAYCSLALYLHTNIDLNSFIKTIQQSYKNLIIPPLSPSTEWLIPVCYDEKVVDDLLSFCHAKKISKAELIALHCAPLYTLDFFGFLPGFPYLSGLNPQLYMPRHSQAKATIAAGTVAIGGQQTGIYPSNSPAGWHAIGRTPVRLFNAHLCPPCELLAGDKIKFSAVSYQQYLGIEKLISSGKYVLKKRECND